MHFLYKTYKETRKTLNLKNVIKSRLDPDPVKIISGPQYFLQLESIEAEKDQYTSDKK